MQEIEKTVLKLARELFSDWDLTPVSGLSEAEGYDSVQHTIFLSHLEEMFDIAIADAEVLRNSTVREVAALIAKKKNLTAK